MILLDNRIGRAKPEISDLLPYFQRAHIPTTYESLHSGDIAFLGHGPTGPSLIGIERKRLRDLLNSMTHSGRLTATQIPEMLETFHRSYLIVEGHWRTNPNTGVIEEWWDEKKHWTPIISNKRQVLTADIMSFLTSIETFAGVNIRYSTSPESTVRHCIWLYQYWDKPWDQHQTFKVFPQFQDRPTLLGRPGLVRRMAAQLDGIGWAKSSHVESKFRSVEAMVAGGPDDWLVPKLIGPATAMKVWKDLRREGA